VAPESFTVHDDWMETGISVEQLVPEGWDPARHPTLIFLHGDNTAPSQYHCYRELLASCCVRSLYPRQPTSKRSQLEPLGWDLRFIRWTNLVTIYEKVAAEQEAARIFVGGHSIGAYTALLAAGARSEIAGRSARDCDADSCRPLAAAGYIAISSWPAQGARKRRPFWFPRRAFEALSPNRYVAYGTRDNARADRCLRQQPPSCRGDAYLVDQQRADELNLRLDVVEGFEHTHFMCNPDWRKSHQHPQQIRAFVERLADWVAATNAAQASRPPDIG
jgi:pimeloyl-ACP methyl ester carboxylesterase